MPAHRQRSAAPRNPVEDRILAAAVRLFAERGFDGASVQEVVDAAQVTKGALYHYFDSKVDLLFEIYHALITRQLADFDRIVAAGLPPAETVREVVEALVRSTATHIDEAKVFTRDKHRLDDQRMHAVRAERRRYHVAFREIIQDGQDAGVFSAEASAETVTFIVFGMVNEMPLWYRANGPKPAAELAAEAAAFILAALTPRPAGG
ncbi:TetR/AcrR family transcriptional regulator [Actinomadura craniellae]|uniref:TetR/AcrR family transcriptional regulator n=1 Tax=Actinomadura craniellae TaxID=2231787 RepID=UPI001F21FF79|nr:TetR/AcrR family transcriptional regulator [Actinomadura craniellae]